MPPTGGRGALGHVTCVDDDGGRGEAVGLGGGTVGATTGDGGEGLGSSTWPVLGGRSVEGGELLRRLPHQFIIPETDNKIFYFVWRKRNV